MDAMKNVELGVFLPVGNNGWIMSSTSPQFMPTWELNRDVTVLAEEIGFDYVFSMAKWRGIGGATKFWDCSIESLTLMSALAPVTKRLRLVCSVAPTIIQPAVFAKMAATLDAVSGGRLTVNIVSAGNFVEYSQMGLYPEDFESYRYEYTEEWLRIVKALWTEPSVTFQGRYFTLEDCRSDPKPLQQPHPPIVCATNSERGFRFVAEACDEAFLAGMTEELRASTKALKQMAEEHARRVKTETLIVLIPADTDEDAQRLVMHYRQGADWQAIAQVYDRTSSGSNDRDLNDIAQRFDAPRYLYYYAPAYAGGPETIADAIEDLAVNGGVDGLVVTFPDYIEGLTKFGRDVMPILKTRGLHPANVPVVS